MKSRTLLSSLTLASLSLVPLSAWAQEEPPPMEEPMPAEPAPMEPEPAPMEAAPETAPMAEAPTMAEAPVEEEESYPAGWFRVDLDALGFQAWFGATHDIGFDLATDVYLVAHHDDATFGEFDIGPVISAGPLTLTPMAGIGFSFAGQKATYLIAPQLFTILGLDPLYFESWIQAFFASPFTEGADDNLYFRNILLFQVVDHLAIGAEADILVALNNTEDDADAGIEGRETLQSLGVGPAVSLNYGKDNTLLLWLGYETQESAHGGVSGDAALTGRFTFVRTW